MSERNRRVFPATCGPHRSLANLVVSNLDDGRIEFQFDPHVTGACAITLDETAATALFDALGEWLG